MASNVSVLCVLLATVFCSCNGARILFGVPTPSVSHQVVFQPLWRELSLRGHQVTVLTTNPLKDPTLTNLTEIDLGFSYKTWNEKVNNLVINDRINSLYFSSLILELYYEVIEEQLLHESVQNFLNDESQKFDLLVVEFSSPAYMALSNRFNCPYIAMMSLDPSNVAYEHFGSPTHPVVFLDSILWSDKVSTFTDRLNVVLLEVGWKLIENMFITNRANNLIEKIHGSGYPPADQIMQNASLIFINTDLVFSKIRPLGPNTIRIGGGIHRTASKPLPDTIKKILDESTNGFVYFSLGANVKSKDLPKGKLDVIVKTFKELPQYNFLWKFELDEFPVELPENVLISKWFPQQDIFKHPNIKLFVTQGGRQSLHEAIYNHVPIVGIPMFGDHPKNMQNIVRRGLGLELNYETLEVETFKKVMLEVIENLQYKETIRKLTSLALDEPMNGLEKAVWWTEYVLRHNGAAHLRSPLLDIPLYQYLFLDIILFVILVLTVLVYVMVKIVKIAKILPINVHFILTYLLYVSAVFVAMFYIKTFYF